MTILITGVCGFLGAHLFDELHRRGGGNRVTRIARVPCRGHIACDLRDRSAVRRTVIRICPRVVYHLAGTTRPCGWGSLWETHVSATINLMEALSALPKRRRPRVIIAGSSAEYGRPNLQPVREDCPCLPITTYGSTKHSQTLAALFYRKEFPVIVARIFNAIGPGIPENLALGAFARQLSCIADHHQPPIMATGNLSARRDFIDVRDVARALADLGQDGRPGEIYNVASGQAISVSTLLRRLLTVSSLRVGVHRDPTRMRPEEVPVITGSYKKLSALTGWQPRITLTQTLQDVWSELRGQRTI